MAKKLEAEGLAGLGPDHFLRLFGELKAARRPMETAVAAYRSVLARMKADGVDTFALSVLEKLIKVEGEQAVVHLRNVFRYAGWSQFALPGLRQGDLFGKLEQPSDEAVERYSEGEAEDHGFRSGAAGQKFDANPHEAGTAAHAAWARGWNRGQEKAVLAAFGGKPGRPPKTETQRKRVSGAAPAEPVTTTVDPSLADEPKPQRGAKAKKPADPKARARADNAATASVDATVGEAAVH